MQKSDEGETLVYAQGDQPPRTTQMVRLGDQTLVSVAGLKVPEGWVGDMVDGAWIFSRPEDGHVDALYDQLADMVAKSETPQDDARSRC